jgi:hypothetical protein
MTALAKDAIYPRRGAPGRNEFGYAVAIGEKVFRGSLVAINAAGTMQRIQTASSLAFLGMSAQQLDNTSGAVASAVKIEALKGTWGIPVPAATSANINANVYCTDDGTLTLTVGSNLLVGILVGIEGGLTYVQFTGS